MAVKMRTWKPAPRTDPFCGKSVDPGKATKLIWEMKAYFFCSENCKRRFQLDPPGDAGF